MNAALSLKISHGSAVYDASTLFGSVVNAGGYDQVARTLDFSLLSPRYDHRQPSVPVALGDNVQFFVGADLQFDGYIFSLQRDSGSEAVEVSCADRGFYLKQSQAAYRFNGQTAEEIARQICRDYGIAVGNLAQTGVPIRRNFPGVSLYQIIQTAYSLAGQQTGERYMVRFRGAAMDVIAKARKGAVPVLEPGSSLLTATVTESAQQLVSQVGIYDDSGRLIRTRRNEKAIAQCGVVQRYLKTSKDTDTDAEAAAILADNDIQRTITVDTLGDHTLISGGTVIAREPVTRLYGLYWIDQDAHTWKGGVYRNKMTLNLRNLMDDVEAGRELAT